MSSNGTSAGPSKSKLRTLFITEDDPLYVIRFFDVFFAEYPRDRIELIGITVDRAFHEPIWKTLERMLRFYGLFGVIRLSLRFLLAKLRGRSIEQLARQAQVPIVPARSVNDPEYIERLGTLAPDVIVSVAAPEIFRKNILAVPRLGCINVHSGRLPTYRGMMPNFWQMMRGESSATVTVHEMAEKLDAGGVLATLSFPIEPRDSLDRVITGTKQEAARLVARVLLELAEGKAVPVPVDMSQASYFSFPKPDDVKEFRRRGHRLL